MGFTMFKLIAGLAVALFVTAQAVPAAAQTYKLQPGDVVQIEVLEDPGLNRPAVVLPDGTISFPMVGSVPAAGRTVDQLRGSLAQGLASNFAATPNVYVSVGQIAPRQQAVPRVMNVYVMGEVAGPGKRQVSPDTNLLQLLAESGGLSKFAARNRIELHRTDKTGASRVYIFDLDQVAGGNGRVSGMTALAPGDVVVVPQRRLFE
jgi:polysaccharide export outer membrane protein